MRILGFFVFAYFAIVFVMWIYWGNWGDHAHMGFAYNFGRALVWPAAFESVRKIMAGIILLAVLGFLGVKK